MRGAGVAIVLAVLVVSAVSWFILRTPDGPTAVAAREAGTGSAAAVGDASAAGAPSTVPRPVTKTSRIGKERRAALAEMIRRANEARRSGAASASAPTGGTTPVPTVDAESDATIVRTTMKDAMRELIPFLAECYSADENLPPLVEVVADMTLTGDPDIGTIADANSVVAKDGSALPASFTTCLRDTLVEIEMPPLSEGGSVKVHYPFTFADDERTLPDK